jgi:hypothetical protein
MLVLYCFNNFIIILIFITAAAWSLLIQNSELAHTENENGLNALQLLAQSR